MMLFVCEENKCTGCMACLEVCSKNAITVSDDIDVLNAVVDEKKCINCNACHEVCQKNVPISLIEPKWWYQGWADEDIRKRSSSGGFATQIMLKFISEGGYVCSCRLDKGEFTYLLTNDKDDILGFAGSKYVKSNPSGIYKRIKAKLKDGKKVLMIGLPCHIAAVKKYLHGKYENIFYTVDLICHGTPSSKLLDSFLQEKGFCLSDIKDIKFRKKNTFAIYVNDKCVTEEGTRDRYTMGFLKGLFYTENCYECAYAQFNRVSDITIGDSWGTELKAEEKKGVSIALCQTEKGKQLLENSGLVLKEVNISNAINANHQLEYPMKISKERKIFFDILKKRNNFLRAVFAAFPKDCIKQDIKAILIKLKIW